MRLFSRSGKRRWSRGQSLVEFALTLPILMLFLLTAIDLGRVFIGYVNMQNMVRIAANYASENPTAWKSHDTTKLGVYGQQVMNDAAMNNCALPVSGGKTQVASPTFPSGTAVGGTAVVTFTCRFQLLAPYWSLIGLFPGNAIAVTSSAEFPIRTGVAGTSDYSLPVPVPDFGLFNTSGVGQTIFKADSSGQATVMIKDQSANNPNRWSWCANWSLVTNTCLAGAFLTQDATYPYPSPGTYYIRLVAGNDGGWSDPFVPTDPAHVVVVQPSGMILGFTATPTSAAVPSLTVNFADTTVPPTGFKVTGWLWNFGDTVSNTDTAKTPTHTYSTPGSYTVSLTVSGDWGATTYTITKTHLIVVGTPPPNTCQVPSLSGHQYNDGETMWAGKGFAKKNYTAASNAPNGTHWVIGYQSLAGGAWLPCTTSIKVSTVAP